MRRDRTTQLRLLAALSGAAALFPAWAAGADADQDGLPDSLDACPYVTYAPGFDAGDCAPMDGNPANDPQPECKARERVVQTLLGSGVFVTHIAFSLVRDGRVHFADAFTYVGGGNYVHDPAGIHRLYRVGSTSKPVTAVAAKILEEAGELSLDDDVSDEDAGQAHAGGEVTLRQLLSHRGAFRVDSGALHLFCYPGDLAAFWSEEDDLVSPHYDSPVYGHLGGGYEYSAFNYSLAGAYLARRTGESFESLLRTRVFDRAGMCTASLDGARAAGTPIGSEAGVSQAAVMHVGPYINLVSPTDARCEDNFYSSDDLPGDPYSWQVYRLDEAGAEARDPAGGVIASVVDMAHFAAALVESYHGPGGLLSPAGIRDLWGATSDLGCSPNCPYERYYGLGFFTATTPGLPATQAGHGGSRAGYASGFVLRPEAGTAVCVLANADVSTVALSNLAKTILNEAAPSTAVGSGEAGPMGGTGFTSVGPNPMASGGSAVIRFSLAAAGPARVEAFDVRGRLVGTPAGGRFPAGPSEVRWRPAEDGLPPGTYFLRLATPAAAAFRKIVLLP